MNHAIIQVYVLLPHAGLGSNATPEDYGAWVNYVTTNLRSACGILAGVHEVAHAAIPIPVIYFAPGLQKEDAPDDACDRVRAALKDLWERFGGTHLQKKDFEPAIVHLEKARADLEALRAGRAGHPVPDLLALFLAHCPAWDVERARGIVVRFAVAVHTDVRQFHQTALQSLSRRVRAATQEHPFQGRASRFEIGSLIEWSTSGSCPSRSQHDGPKSPRPPWDPQEVS